MDINLNRKLVSIVIPTYNCGKYIRETLDSVFMQTHTDLDVVVVDDGSQDNTKEVLKPYLNRINYLYQENRGLAGARNRGLSMAKGKYIALLDADDIWLPNKLELQLKCFDMYPKAGMVFSDFSSFDFTGKISLAFHKEYYSTIFKNYKLTLGKIFQQKQEISNNYFSYSGDVRTTMFLGNIIMPSTVMIKKDCITDVGVFNEKYKNDPDYDLFLRIAAHFECVYVDASLMKYRILENSMSRKAQKAMFGVIEVIDIVKNFLKDNPDFAENREAIVNQRFSRLFFEQGYAYFSKTELDEARKSFIQSIKYDFLLPGNPERYLFLLASFCPAKLLMLVKRFKNICWENFK